MSLTSSADSTPGARAAPGVDAPSRETGNGWRRKLHGLRRDHLYRGSAFIVATTIASSGLGFVYWLVAAHFYSPPAVGLAAALVSASTLVSIVVNPGLHSGLVAELPHSRTDREWSARLNVSLVAAAALSAVGAVLAVFVLPLLSSRFASIHGLIAFWFVLATVGASAGLLIDHAFLADRSGGAMLARNTAFSAGKLAVLPLVALGVTRTGAGGIFGSWTFVLLLSLGLSLFVLLPRVRAGYGWAMAGGLHGLRRSIKALAGHHGANIGCLLPMYVLPVEVVARVSTSANAVFYICWMLCGPLFTLSPSVASALFVEGTHHPDTVLHKARRSLAILAAITIPLAITFALIGQFLLGLFGPAYGQGSYTLLVVLAASALPDAVSNIWISVLRVQRRLLEATALNMTMGGGSIVLAWILLPRHGVMGAGLAWLAAQVFGVLWVAGSTLRQHLRPHPPGPATNT